MTIRTAAIADHAKRRGWVPGDRAWLIVITTLAPLQADTTFEALTIPPPGAGSCLAPLASRGADSAHSRRLVIKSLEPGNHRTISLMVNVNGQSIGLHDGVFVMQNDLRAVGTTVTAILLPNGGVYGTRSEISVTMPEQVRDLRDVGEIQALIDQASRSHITRPLVAADERRVYALVEFLRKRCPA